MTGRPSDRAIAAAFWETTRRVLNSHEEVEGLIINRARELDAGVGGDVSPAVLHEMNGKLCDFSMRWGIDGDYVRCRKCTRTQLTNYRNEAFIHARGCKNRRAETHPWVTFLALLAPLTTPPAAVVPADWVLMPRKLDIDMEIAFAEQWFSKRRCVDDCELQDCYDALIAAAPAQEVG